MNHRPLGSTLTYRAEVDGLRAFAVVPVILFHAGFDAFSGGYVGVDVFFVISGYLITKIIMAEIDDGRFSVASFYARRARRILPALVFICAVSTIAAWFILSPLNFREYGQSLVSVATFSSNIFFWWHTDYFAQAAELRPMLHTWSLAVEEQFYLFYPLLLAAIWPRGPRAVISVVLALVLSSLILAEILVRQYPGAAFFLLPTRFWELGIGCLCALLPESLGRMSERWRELLAALGLGMIVAATLAFDKRTLTPSLITLIPTVGTALVLVFARAGTRTARLLSLRPIVFVGLISFSAYLWHQPIFAFAHHLAPGDTGPVLMFALALAAIGLAVPTWYLIEQPFRRRGPTAPTLRAGAAALIGLAALGPVFNVGFQQVRVPRFLWSEQALELARQERFEILREVCTSKSWIGCDVPIDGAFNVLVMGDSQAIDAYNTLRLVMGDAIDLNRSDLPGCPMHPDLGQLVGPQHLNFQECLELNKERYDPAYLAQFDAIAINVLLSWYTEEHLIDYLEWLKANFDGPVLVFGGAFIFSEDLPAIAERGLGDAPPESVLARDPRPTEGTLADAVRRLGYAYFGQGEVFCPDGSCTFDFGEGNLLTYDAHHLSMPAVRRLAAHYHDAIVAALAPGMSPGAGGSAAAPTP